MTFTGEHRIDVGPRCVLAPASSSHAKCVLSGVADVDIDVLTYLYIHTHALISVSTFLSVYLPFRRQYLCSGGWT